MTSGATFPPIVLFHDGNQHYLADGFHRFMAAQRNAVPRHRRRRAPGTKEDALWFALGANKTNGKRLSDGDKEHAIVLATATFGDKKTQGQIADQVGCSQGFVSKVITRNNLTRPSRVEGKDGKSYPASHRLSTGRIEAIETKLRDGLTVTEIAHALGTTTTTVRKVQTAAGIEAAGRPNTSPQAVRDRRARMRTMAADGYTSIQIADELGLNVQATRAALRQEAIEVPGDRATSHSKRHDSTRIVEHIVMDADNLTADVNLIEFSSLEPDRLGEWVDSLIASKRALDAFIKRLIKEQQKHGEAA
jgi:hypothetical protein